MSGNVVVVVGLFKFKLRVATLIRRDCRDYAEKEDGALDDAPLLNMHVSIK